MNVYSNHGKISSGNFPQSSAQERSPLVEQITKSPLIPCGYSMLDGKTRVSTDRVVIGDSDNTNLEGWVLRLKDSRFPLLQFADCFIELCSPPAKPGGSHALDFLMYTWESQCKVDNAVNKAVLNAYRILINDEKGQENIFWKDRLHKLQSENKVFLQCKRVSDSSARSGWLPVQGRDGLLPVFNDDPFKASCIPGDSGIRIESQFIQLEAEEAEKAVSLIQLPRLSDARFHLQLEPLRPKAATEKESWLFYRFLRALICCSSLERSEISKVIDSGSVTFWRCEGVYQVLEYDAAPPHSTMVHALWEPQTERVFISGSPIDYLADLRSAVIIRLGLTMEEQARLAGLFDLLLLLNDMERFKAKLEHVLLTLGNEPGHLLDDWPTEVVKYDETQWVNHKQPESTLSISQKTDEQADGSDQIIKELDGYSVGISGYSADKGSGRGGHFKNLNRPQGNQAGGPGGHSGWGGGGEGEAHLRLKEYLAANPYIIEPGARLLAVEYLFSSNDRVDLLLEDSRGIPIAIEVESYICQGDFIGIWQAVKYKHLLAVERGLGCNQVRGMVVAPSAPMDVKVESARLGIAIIEVLMPPDSVL